MSRFECDLRMTTIAAATVKALQHSTWRGHRIYDDGSGYRYLDGTLVAKEPDRVCGFCGRENTPEGHDGCLGTIPQVDNACCGHGTGVAYIQFSTGKRLSGRKASLWMKKRAETFGPNSETQQEK